MSGSRLQPKDPQAMPNKPFGMGLCEALCDPNARVRLAAVQRSQTTGPELFLLRNALLFDRDGRVRGLAATRLGFISNQSSEHSLVFRALLEAAEYDSLPSVRQAAWQTLARVAKRNMSATPAETMLARQLGELCQRRSATEPTWWVRTAIAQAVANRMTTNRLEDLLGFLDDPFWRVRHTAIRALVAIGREDEAARHQIVSHPVRSDVEDAAMRFIERAWDERRRDDLVPNLATQPPIDPLWDPDPAVTTANLEDRAQSPSIGLLIELLADAHESTRREAARHIAERGELREVRAALTWLDEPRLPYASAAAVGIAHKLGARTTELVASVFETTALDATALDATALDATALDATGHGALCWAIGWVAATRADDFTTELTALLDHPESSVRREAIEALSRTQPEPAVIDQVASRASASLLRHSVNHGLDETAERSTEREVDGQELYAALELVATHGRVSDSWFAAPIENVSARVRRLLTQVASSASHRDWLDAAANNEDGQTRAIAIERLLWTDQCSVAQKQAAVMDHDPLVREAALTSANATDAEDFVTDVDPNVRRRACKLATRVPRAAAFALATSADRFDKVSATRFLSPTSFAELEALLALSVCSDEGVRSAAVAKLDQAGDENEGLLASLCFKPSSTGRLFRAAISRLCRHDGQRARDALELAWRRINLDHASRRHLAVLGLTLDATLSKPSALSNNISELESASAALQTEVEEAVRTQAAEGSRIAATTTVSPFAVPLGQTGIRVAPLCLSGANELPIGSLHHSLARGVNTFFWEPGYRKLSAFLRQDRVRSRVQVIAGSYHATAEAIEKDVETALRRLGRDSIDVFLIFWVRSKNRLSEEVWNCLQRLKASGKIGAAGFSTHHRDIARSEIAKRPWDVLMLRHSAAHTGAENELLGECAERNVGVFAFTSLCYGRLLQPTPAREQTSAPDCYRYSLSQAGISAVISAPRRHRELSENLTVLVGEPLAEGTLNSMREHGSWIYSRSKDFAALIRRTPREVPRSTQAYQQLFGQASAAKLCGDPHAATLETPRDREPS